MPVYEWSPDYSTSIRVIDNDHKDLFDAIYTFHDAYEDGKGAEQIAATIDCLIKYVDEHFEREERYMEQAGYPDFKSHCLAHADFTSIIQMLHKLYTKDPMSVDVPKVLKFLSDWLTQHILKIDMNYVPYVKGEKSGSSSETEHPDRRTMKTIQVPEDQVELIEEIVDLVSANSIKREALQQVFHQFHEQSDQAKLEKAKKLFCVW
ncbi:MAG: bacteriohemerythrin [Rhodospirillales bacterium]